MFGNISTQAYAMPVKVMQAQGYIQHYDHCIASGDVDLPDNAHALYNIAVEVMQRFLLGDMDPVEKEPEEIDWKSEPGGKGIYLHQPADSPMKVCIVTEEDGDMVQWVPKSNESTSIEDCDGFWWGPIDPPPV